MTGWYFQATVTNSNDQAKPGQIYFLYFRVNLLGDYCMRFAILMTALILTGCDNTTISESPNFSLFETSAGVVYLLNQNTGELKVISSRQAVINSGEVFRDDEGQAFRYLGNGKVEKVDQTPK